MLYCCKNCGRCDVYIVSVDYENPTSGLCGVCFIKNYEEQLRKNNEKHVHEKIEEMNEKIERMRKYEWKIKNGSHN